MIEVHNKHLETFLASLENVAWLSQVGQPTDKDKNLVRIDLDFVLNHHANFIIRDIGDAYEFWDDLLLKTETCFESIIFDNGLLGKQAEINAFIDKLRIDFVEDFFVDLVDKDDKYEGYYQDTYTYVHELIEPIYLKRFLRGAAFEILVSDFDSSLHFFQNLLPWLMKGHWTYGWSGKYPQGKLMLW